MLPGRVGEWYASALAAMCVQEEESVALYWRWHLTDGTKITVLKIMWVHEGLLLSGDCHHCTAQLEKPWAPQQYQEYPANGQNAILLDAEQMEY